VSVVGEGPEGKRVIAIDGTLFPEEVVLKAAYEISGICSVDLSRPAPGEIQARLELRPGQPMGALEEAYHAFRQNLLDFTVRARVLRETKDIQEALLRRAFTEMVPAGLRRA
jgi:His-Xaa-Ser system protein HxsD